MTGYDLLKKVKESSSLKDNREEEHDFSRARSVFERVVEVEYRSHILWLEYAEFEMRNGFVNHARNVWDRCLSLLPCVNQLWLKYIHMEEMLGNVAGARQLFDRWMEWQPDQQGRRQNHILRAPKPGGAHTNLNRPRSPKKTSPVHLGRYDQPMTSPIMTATQIGTAHSSTSIRVSTQIG